MRKTRKQRNQLKGGKFLGQGGYGCTFTDPPLPCWDPRGGPPIRRSSDQISKLMLSADAHKAILKNRMFRRIDPTETYFLSASNSDRCKPVLSSPYINPSDGLDKCHLNPQTPGGLELVFFKNGGTDLQKLTLSAKEYAPFFKSLLNVLEGMTIAHANNIAHLDIKPENIVTQPLPTGEFQTRLIDYDFAIDLPNIVPSDLRPFKNQYIFFPFEAIFIDRSTANYYFPQGHFPQSHLQAIQTRFRQVIKQWFGMFQGDYVKGFVLGDKQPFSETRQQQIGFTEYYTTYQPKLSIVHTNYKEYFKLVDVYQVGYTLGLVLNKFFSCLMICENKAAGKYKIAFKVDLPQKVGYIFTDQFVANGFSQEAENWFKILEEWVLIPYAQLVEDMTSWDLTKRISMADAQYRFGQLLIAMDLSFKEDGITNFLAPLGAVKLKAQPALPDIPSLDMIQVSPASPKVNRPYQIPPTNLRKVQTTLFEGGEHIHTSKYMRTSERKRTSDRQKRRRKTHKKLARK